MSMTSTPQLTFWADQYTIVPGQSTVLHWSVIGLSPESIVIATSVGQPPQWVIPPASTIVVTAAQTTTYTLTATDPLGESTSAQLTVAVGYAPIVTFAAVPSNGLCGQYNLTWSISAVPALTSATIDHGIGAIGPSGSTPIVVLSGSTTYTLTATNPMGTTTATATVSMATHTVGSTSPTVTVDATVASAQNFNSGSNYPAGLYYAEYVSGAWAERETLVALDGSTTITESFPNASPGITSITSATQNWSAGDVVVVLVRAGVNGNLGYYVQVSNVANTG